VLQTRYDARPGSDGTDTCSSEKTVLSRSWRQRDLQLEGGQKERDSERNAAMLLTSGCVCLLQHSTKAN